MGTVVEMVSSWCAWFVLGSGAVLVLARVVGDRLERRPVPAEGEPTAALPAAFRLRAVEAAQEQHVIIRRSVALNTALIPTITIS